MKTSKAGLVLCVVGGCVMLLQLGCEEVRRAQQERETTESKRLAAMSPEERAAEEAQKAEDKARKEQEQAEAKAKRAKDNAKDKLETQAKKSSKEYVKKFLKYPLDADFPWLDYDVWSDDDNVFFNVSSTVKAKNALGANLTHTWKTSLLRADGKWTLLWCEIDGKTLYRNEAAKEQWFRAQEEEDARAQRATQTEEQRKADESRRLAETEKRKKAAELRGLQDAANTLRIAKKFREDGDEEVAKKWLRKVVDQYPESEAAEEAKLLLGESAGNPLPSMRAWTEADGGRQIEAAYVSAKDGKVQLRKSDGKPVTVQMERLSKADQEYVKEMAKTFSP